MENRARDSTTVLKVKVSCCEECPRKVKNALKELNGVASAYVDQLKNQVTITGKLDPNQLIQAIAGQGKKAELYSYKKVAKNKNIMNDEENTREDRGKNTRCSKGKCCNCEKTSTRHRNHPDQGCCCRNGRDKQKADDNGHKCEEHVAAFDESVCGDPYCTLHRRRGIIHDGLPKWDNEDMFSDHLLRARGPFRRQGPLFHDRGSHYPQAFSFHEPPPSQYYRSPMAQPPSSNGYYHPWMPPA